MKILIVKLSAIGDVIHTMPLAAALRKKYPSAEIFWLVEEDAADILVGYDKIDQLIISPRKSALKALKEWRWRDAVRLAKHFWQEASGGKEYDIVIDAHGLLKSALIVGALRAKRKIGFDSLQEGSGLFYDEKIFEDLDKHAVDRYMGFAAYLNAASDVADFSFNLSGVDIEDLLADAGIGGDERFAVISTHALWQTKLWDDRKFAELADMISIELMMKIILTGKSREETAGVERFAKRPLANLAGRTTLRKLTALFRRAALVVSTDSGPMHIAAAVETPVVAIFGPTNEKRTGPYGKNNMVVSAAVDCRPCLSKRCSSMVCMENISVEDVFRAVKRMMPETSNSLRSKACR